MRRRKLLVLLFISFIVTVKAQTTADGVKALDYENYATARRIFSELKKSQPADALNYYYLGIVYCNLGKIDSARMVFTSGTQADPKSIYNYAGLGRTYLEQNNAQQATQNFDKVKSLTTQKDITQYKLIADAYSSAAHPNYEMAVTLLNKAIEYTNKDAEVYWILGKTYEAMSKSGDAVSSYERSTELNPAYAKAFTRIGAIWNSARNINLAKENFDKALHADPNFPPAYRELAEFYFYTGKYELATQTYQKYLDLADKDDDTQFRYGKFLFVQKKYREALNIFNGLKTKITSPILYRLLGYSNYEIGNYEEGLSHMKTFFEKVDTARIISSDYEYLGKLQMKSGQDSIGFITIQKAILLDSTRYELYDTIATYLFKQKKFAQAAIFYERKMLAMPSNAPFKELANSEFQEGKAFYFAGQYVKSDSIFMELGKLSPQWPYSYLFRARCQLFIDSLDTARGKAFPFYNLFISKAYNDTVRLKAELAEAYQYLGNYNTHYRNYGAGLYYFERAVTLTKSISIGMTKQDVISILGQPDHVNKATSSGIQEVLFYGNGEVNMDVSGKVSSIHGSPTNVQIFQTVKAIKENYKTPPGNTIAAAKDSAGYLIPAIINGHSVTVLYDPGLMGIGVTQEGSSQLFTTGSDGEISKGVLVKIGDRSVKNVVVTMVPDEKKPIAIGADVLNKMNIVFVYSIGVLLQR